MTSDKKLALINGWKEVAPSGAKYEYVPTGHEVGNKAEMIVYRNGQRIDKVLLNKRNL